MPPTETVHDLDLEHDMFDDTWSAICSCGWSSDERNAEADAIEDWENHCDVVFMEATQQNGAGQAGEGTEDDG